MCTKHSLIWWRQISVLYLWKRQRPWHGICILITKDSFKSINSVLMYITAKMSWIANIVSLLCSLHLVDVKQFVPHSMRAKWTIDHCLGGIFKCPAAHQCLVKKEPKCVPFLCNDNQPTLDHNLQYSRNFGKLQEYPHFANAGAKCMIALSEHMSITIQQDGSKAHFVVKNDVCMDAAWNETLREYGLENKINVITQPANSPDLNVNDLGFFNSLQSYYWKENPKNAMQLIAMVRKVFDLYPQENWIEFSYLILWTSMK